MTNRVIIGAFAVVLILTCALAQVFISKYEDKLATIDALEKAKNEAVTAQRTGEATIQSLRQDNEKLQLALDKWKKEYAEIERNTIAAKKQISCLEAENEEMRTILHTAIPDAVWNIMFPKGTGSTCGNKD